MVLLPAPVGPTIATDSPGATRNEMSSSTGSRPYENVTLRSSTPPRIGMASAPGRSAMSAGVAMISLIRSAAAEPLLITCDSFDSDFTGL